MILFLDDERVPENVFNVYFREIFKLPPFTNNQKILIKNREIYCVKNYEEAVEFVKTNGLPEMVFFDNDLGKGLEGYDFLKWLCDQNLGFFEAYFHTANPIARENMKIYYNNWIKAKFP